MWRRGRRVGRNLEMKYLQKAFGVSLCHYTSVGCDVGGARESVGPCWTPRDGGYSQNASRGRFDFCSSTGHVPIMAPAGAEQYQIHPTFVRLYSTPYCCTVYNLYNCTIYAICKQFLHVSRMHYSPARTCVRPHLFVPVHVITTQQKGRCRWPTT